MLPQVHLVNQSAQLAGVNPPGGGDQTGPDLDDKAHKVIQFSNLAMNWQWSFGSFTKVQ
jgi:hypothetical protein